MLSAPSCTGFTLASFSILFTFSQHPALAFNFDNSLSWASDSIGYYESFSHNDPVIRGGANIGSTVDTTIQAGKGILNDVKRVDEGASRAKVLTGTIAKYSTQFVMQAGINVAAAFAAPACATSPLTAVGCTGLFVTASQFADKLSNAYREWAESFFEEKKTPLRDPVECGSMEHYSRIGGSGCGTEEETPQASGDEGFNGTWQIASQEGLLLQVTDNGFSLRLGAGMESCGTITGTFSLKTADDIAGSFSGRCADLNMLGSVGMQRSDGDYTLANCVSMATGTPNSCSLGYFATAERVESGNAQ